ncbi:hypothetical protein PYW07_009189 [Mythimna separata]|uniref:DDE Tnp4 domain-containing protein n=1 Tax=Mythimna separata TaxID=271217 RepID=A0AAD7YC20_MYTSE|nr:hypothetical protein PYW07_009189 [Mythimna separata]
MMTPILGAAPGSPEEHYTELHCKVRNTVERCIGVLKGRWRCLLAHRVLHYDPVTAAKIVNACVVLHNIAKSRNVPMPEPHSDDVDNDQQSQVFRELTTDFEAVYPKANHEFEEKFPIIKQKLLKLLAERAESNKAEQTTLDLLELAADQ